MSTLLDAPPDAARGRGSAVVDIYDADQLRHAIGSGKVRTFLRGDGSVTDLVNAVKFRQLPRTALLQPRKYRSVEHRPGMWVPKHELDAAGYQPDETRDFGTNLWVTAGWARILGNLTAVPTSTQVFDATHTRIGVGNGVTAAAVGNTDLAASAGSTNRQFKLVDSGPTIAASGGTGSVAWPATFATGQANFVWAEWCVDNGTADGTTVVAVMINRAVPNSLLTKTSAVAITLTTTLAGT